MKIFLDDKREPPGDGWTVVRDTDALVRLIYGENVIEEISLDHDLGEDEPTGYDFLNWIEQHFAGGFYYGVGECKFTIHSANIVGWRNMNAAIESIDKLRPALHVTEAHNDD